MTKFRDLIKEIKKKHTLLLCTVVIIFFEILLQVSGLVKFLQFSSITTFVVKETLRAMAVIGLVFFLGEQHIFSKHEVKFFKGLKAGAFLLGFMLLSLTAFSLVQGFQAPLQNIIMYIVFCLMIGLAEEGCFRGLVTNLLAQRYVRDRKSLYFVVLISGSIFGLTHLTNVFAGVSLSGAFFQMICTAVMGCYLSAVYLRTGNIWVVVFMHGLQDFLAFNLEGIVSGAKTIVESTSGYSVHQLIGVPMFLIPTLFLLRKSKATKIIQRYSTLSLKTGSEWLESQDLQSN